jgi:mono/diheme cytochrome c family protein
MPTVRPALLLAGLLALPRAATAADAPPVSFNEQIRPLLAQNCLACHGPDANDRKANLRLDLEADAFAPVGGRGRPGMVARQLQRLKIPQLAEPVVVELLQPLTTEALPLPGGIVVVLNAERIKLR